MKKVIIGIIFVCFLLVIPVSSIGKLEATSYSSSHTVIVEFAAMSKSECSVASRQLYEIFSDENLDFYYITLVSDENDVAETRLQELGISEFPGVSFDGGYIKLFGEQENTNAYASAITESLSRNVAPIELYLDAYWTSSPCFPMVISNVEAYNNGYEDYHGRLLISIVEIESRWEDNTGRPYNYALVDYAADEEITIDPLPLGSFIDTYTWFPNIDVCGIPADPNVLVIASVFSDDSGFADATVVSRLVDGDQPTKPNKPDGPVKVKIGEKYSYSTLSSDPDDDKIKYGWDWDGDYNIDEWTDYYDSDEEIIISHIWNEKGNYSVRVKAKDEARLESFWSDPSSVSMPKNKATNTMPLFLRFLENHPRMFPILRHMLGL